MKTENESGNIIPLVSKHKRSRTSGEEFAEVIPVPAQKSRLPIGKRQQQSEEAIEDSSEPERPSKNSKKRIPKKGKNAKIT